MEKTKKRGGVTLSSLIFIVGFMLLLLSFCSQTAFSVNVINNTNPEIYVKYGEALKFEDIEYKLENLEGKSFSVSKINDTITNDESIFFFKVNEELAIGDYIFSIQACDTLGNCGDFWQGEFKVELPDLSITWVKPRFAIFNSIELPMQLKTNREAKCRYDTADNDFDDMQSKSVTQDKYVLTHNFNNLGLPDTTLYIKCVDKFDDEALLSQYINYDNQQPTIEVTAEDAYTSPLKTTLEISVVNNKEVICRYSRDQELPYDSMSPVQSSGAYDIDDEDSYMMKLYQNLFEKDLVNNKKNKFYVKCMAKNGRYSKTESVVFDVDKNKNIDIRFKYPTKYVNESEIVLNITTSIPSRCNYKTDIDEDDYKGQFRSSNTYEKEHISQKKVSVEEGRNYLGVRCEDDTRNVEEDMNFYVDLTNPVMKYVNIISDSDTSNVISEKNKIKFNFSAEENSSGIHHYEYMIHEQGTYGSNNLTGWETISTSKENDEYTAIASLNDQYNYFIEMRVFDNSMRSSSKLKSSPVSYRITNNSLCSGLNGICLLGEPCQNNNDCESLFCLNFKCATPSCNDSYKNGGETDVDCGGSCNGCVIGAVCSIGSDCLSGNCVEGKCVEASKCNNGIQDDGETDVDCGGSCNGCGVGYKCISGSDCLSDNCRIGNEYGVCFEPGGDKDKDGILDENDNCPIDYNENQEDLDEDGIGDLCDNDKDGDGMSDEWELIYGLDPKDPTDASKDNDNDGITNLKEFIETRTSPIDVDTDGDGYGDYDEYYIHGTDPTDPESYPRSTIMFFIVSILFILLCFVSGYYVYYAKKNEWDIDFSFNKKEDIEPQKIEEPKIHHDINASEMMPLPSVKPSSYSENSEQSKKEEVMPLKVKEGLTRLIKPKSYVDRLSSSDEGVLSKKLGLDKVVKKDIKNDAVSDVRKKLGGKVKADINSLKGVVSKKQENSYDNLSNLAKKEGISGKSLDSINLKKSENTFKDLESFEGKKEDAFSKLRKKNKN